MKKETRERITILTNRFVEAYYKLYSLRLAKSKADFCRNTGIHYTNFWGVEKGDRIINLENIYLLVQNYDVSTDWILLGTGEFLRKTIKKR